MTLNFKAGILVWLVSMFASAATVQIKTLDTSGRPLADTVVYLESKDAKAATRPGKSVEIAQINKEFVPRVVVVSVGTAIQFPNRDTVRHHVYSFSPAKPFELKLYSGKEANPVVFDRAGTVVIGCNIHDNMVGWVLAVESPYHAITPAAGVVTLDGVPPGNYRLRAWHPSMAVNASPLDQAVTVGATGSTAQVTMVGISR